MTPEDEARSSAAPFPGKVSKRACDCCRKRKVKCDGHSPCGPCKKAAIKCAYLQPPRKKGPKGLRSARVLQALRNIDQAALATSDSGEDGSSNDLNMWSWDSAGSSPDTTFVPSFPPDQAPTSAARSVPGTASHQGYFTTRFASDHPSATEYPPTHANGGQHPDNWTSMSSASSSHETEPYHLPRQGPAASLSRLPNEIFLPYVRLFFNHLYTIMPIIDRRIYLNPDFYDSSSNLTSETYVFLCALCAATIVQLDAAAQLPPLVIPPGLPAADSPAELFVNECLRERSKFDYIEHPTTLTIMTSFFIFAYYGNNEHHQKAWHYLQESISFSQSLDLDDENVILKLDPIEAQWRRRLYWLLFITERAYAIQRRKQTRLQPSIHLPLVFESEDPQLLNGFVNLVHLFSAIDDNFVRVWRGTRRGSLCSAPWLADMQQTLDGAAVSGMEMVTETQHLDIGITREWLHVLAWQMGVSNGLILSDSLDPSNPPISVSGAGMLSTSTSGRNGMTLSYPVELARRVVSLTASASRLALDSHGIGMEQKLSDIAGCLADALRCVRAEDTSFVEGKMYLNLLLQQLSRMRGKESRYLKPLMGRVESLLGNELVRELDPPRLAARVDEVMGLGIESAPHLDKLGVSAVSGNAGLGCATGVSLDGAGKVFDEEETRLMGPWVMV